MSRLEVRRLDERELALAPPLLAPEGWTFEPAELARIHRLGGSTGAFLDGRLAGFLSFLETPPIRWIGNVVVSPAARGAGVGAALVGETLRDAPRAALYSVEKAEPLYRRAGFVPDGDLLALRARDARALKETAATRMEPHDLDEVVALDTKFTGMDRRGLLGMLRASHPDHAWLLRRDGRLVGYGIAKAYSDVTEIGPIVAEAPADAAELLDTLVAGSEGPHDLAVHAANAPMLEAAAKRGFERAFRAVIMFRGAAPAWEPAAYAAAAGLEKG